MISDIVLMENMMNSITPSRISEAAIDITPPDPHAPSAVPATTTEIAKEKADYSRGFDSDHLSQPTSSFDMPAAQYADRKSRQFLEPPSVRHDQVMVEKWNPEKKYSNGDRVKDDGKLYEFDNGNWKEVVQSVALPSGRPTPPSPPPESTTPAVPPSADPSMPDSESTNRLAKELKFSPVNSPEARMYHSARAVGMVVEIAPDGYVRNLGTGFLITDSSLGDDVHILTNEHVLSFGVGNNIRNGTPLKFEFWLGNEDIDGSPELKIPLDNNITSDKSLDYSLFSVNSRYQDKAKSFDPLLFDSSNENKLRHHIFVPNHVEKEKRISYQDQLGRPAEITGIGSDIGSDYRNKVFYHTATPNPGISGSPLISRSSGKVVGLNFGAMPVRGSNGYELRSTAVDISPIRENIIEKLKQ